MRKIGAVLFDLDGTLINSVADLAAAANYALRQAGYAEHSVEEYKYFVGNGIPVMLGRASGHDGDKQVIASLLPVFMERYRHHFADQTAAYDGMAGVLDSLRQAGVKTAVITNKAYEMAKIILDKLYPGQLDFIIGQREDVPCKPDPTGTRIAMRTLGVTPEECLFVGDSGVDMQTACGCGAYPVGVLWGFRTADELNQNGAKVLIDRPEKLLELIQ